MSGARPIEGTMDDDRYDRLIAAHYDDAYAVIRDPSGDAAFYHSLARASGGPVLELGCGTGRVLLPIARDGIACVGLDPSPAMLDVLRAKDPPPNLALVCARMQDLDLGAGRFGLVTLPFRGFSHLLTVDEQLAVLGRIRDHLRPGGVLALDVFDPKLESTARAAEPERLAVTFAHGGREVRRWDTITRDHTRQVVTVRMRYEGGPPELTGTSALELRWFYRYELEHLVHRAGFAAVDVFGGYAGEPWRAFGETVLVARRA